MELIKFSNFKAKFNSDFFNDNVEIKPYLPFANKKLIIDNVIASCITEENGLKKIDYAMKNFSLEFAIMNAYTNIDFSEVENVVEVYDWLKEQGIIEHVTNKVYKTEYMDLVEVLDSQLEEEKRHFNSLEGIVARFASKVVEKIPDSKELQKLIKSASKELKGFDIGKLDQIQEIMKVIK
jgi:hypothetical protein